MEVERYLVAIGLLGYNNSFLEYYLLETTDLINLYLELSGGRMFKSRFYDDKVIAIL